MEAHQYYKRDKCKSIMYNLIQYRVILILHICDCLISSYINRGHEEIVIRMKKINFYIKL